MILTQSRWVVVSCALLGIGALVIAVLALREREEAPAWAERYPELAAVDAKLIARVRAGLPAGVVPLSEDHRAEKKRALLLEALDGLESEGDGAPFALLAVLMETHGKRRFSRMMADYVHDEEVHPVAAWLAARPSAALDDVLLRLAADGEISDDLRLTAIIALCRAGNLRAVRPLAAIALDVGTDTDVRRDILYRLPRIETPLSETLQELLELPFHELDRLAAAAIARAGEPVAPSLLVEGLRWGRGFPSSQASSLAEGALAIADGDAPLLKQAGESVRVLGQRSWPGEGSIRDRVRGVQTDLATALEDWMVRHPEMLETEFERGRRAYRESERYRRERAVGSFEEILAADEADLDLAACALALERVDPAKLRAYRESRLGGLDRLSRLVAREIRGLEEPERIVEVLNRRLLRGPRASPSTWEGGLSTQLGTVLVHRTGNCMGLSLLYLAVADRLDLPIRAVLAPEHVFVRWDDGTTRRNIEVTEGGVEYSDEHYMTRRERLRIRPDEVEKGLFLVPLGTKQVLSRLLGNLALVWLESPRLRGTERYRTAIEHADRAIRLDPRNDFAYLNRAQARIRRDPSRAEEALADLEAALAIRPESFHAQQNLGGLHAQLGNLEEALAAFERALALAPEDAEARHNRILVLLELGRLVEAAEACEVELEVRPESRRTRRARLVAWIRLRREGWLEELDALVEEPAVSPGLHLTAAALLLAPEGDLPADAAMALAVLDRIRELAEKTAGPSSALIETVGGEGGTLVIKEEEVLVEEQRRYFDLRVSALSALGRTEEARAAQQRLAAISGN